MAPLSVSDSLGTCMVMPVHAQTYEYVAVTEAPQANATGAVRAGTLVWHCESNRCSISGPWPAPARLPANHSLPVTRTAASMPPMSIIRIT